ncbi:MAG: DUF47 family protein [Spirochaetaceae bacterium]
MLFSRAKSVETNIDQYIDNVLKASLIFELGIKYYFERNNESFEKKTKEMKILESESDHIRRDIKHTLYRDLLIPESRGDVLGLIEHLDDVINTAKKDLLRFSIEKPKIWPELTSDFLELTELSTKCVREVVGASRAFFREPNKVADYLVAVHYLESEADKIEERIMRKSFEGTFITEFSEKVHMRYFAEKISKLADLAESVADRLDIYTIKRTI